MCTILVLRQTAFGDDAGGCKHQHSTAGLHGSRFNLVRQLSVLSQCRCASQVLLKAVLGGVLALAGGYWSCRGGWVSASSNGAYLVSWCNVLCQVPHSCSRLEGTGYQVEPCGHTQVLVPRGRIPQVAPC